MPEPSNAYALAALHLPWMQTATDLARDALAMKKKWRRVAATRYPSPSRHVGTETLYGEVFETSTATKSSIRSEQQTIFNLIRCREDHFDAVMSIAHLALSPGLPSGVAFPALPGFPPDPQVPAFPALEPLPGFPGRPSAPGMPSFAFAMCATPILVENVSVLCSV